MFTVITEGNKVRQYHGVEYLHEVRKTENDYVILNDTGEVEVYVGNPITWPTDAKNGLQAIVDVKAGTLRFGMNNGPLSRDEFVVSEYVAPAPHIFDQVDNWPKQHRECLGTMPLPEGWEWKWFGDDWVLSNGTIGLKREDWFKYKFGDAVPAKSFGAVEDSAPVHVLDRISSWPDSALATGVAPEGWGWKYLNYGWVLVNDKEGVEFHEGHWLRNHHKNKKKYADVVQPAVTAASMLTAALGHMEDRAKTYDAPGGERSMGKTVSAFNIITGHTLTEEAGWLFMEILKQVRSQQGNYRADNYEDMVAYAALRGECAARERGNK